MSIVNLISITPDAEKTIAYCARVSNPANQDNKNTAPKLINYFQEFSQRYADASTLEFARPPHLRRQDLKNRQNSIDDLEDTLSWHHKIAYLYAQSEDLYREMVSSGVAKECAREILPLGTPTRLYMSGTVRSWMHYVDLRSANGTQLEHQQIALECEKVLTSCLPVVMKARNAVRGS